MKAYGATKPGDKIQRSTVLVDKEGKVAAVWNPVSTLLVQVSLPSSVPPP